MEGDDKMSIGAWQLKRLQLRRTIAIGPHNDVSRRITLANDVKRSAHFRIPHFGRELAVWFIEDLKEKPIRRAAVMGRDLGPGRIQVGATCLYILCTGFIIVLV